MQPVVFLMLKKDKDDRYVIAIEDYNPPVEAYSEDIEIVHWHIRESGPPPKIDSTTPWVDPRTTSEKRRAGYMAESDWMKASADGEIEDGVDASTAKSEWKLKRAAIKKKYK